MMHSGNTGTWTQVTGETVGRSGARRRSSFVMTAERRAPKMTIWLFWGLVVMMVGGYIVISVGVARTALSAAASNVSRWER